MSMSKLTRYFFSLKAFTRDSSGVFTHLELPKLHNLFIFEQPRFNLRDFWQKSRKLFMFEQPHVNFHDFAKLT